jgi:hypothetical protein
MTSNILPSQSFRPAQPLGFGNALSSLAVATHRVSVALLSALRPTRQKRPMSRVDEANELREYANQFLRSDRSFAADLMAAADRHELGESA